jgi:hypothetical protein
MTGQENDNGLVVWYDYDITWMLCFRLISESIT